MIDPEDPDYGELAQYYGSVSLLLSSTNVNAAELMEEIDSFAAYNQSEYTNQNDNKFINYKTIGRIYATYVTEDGVAQNADNVMNQAIEDLEEYTGTTLDVNDYFYSYYDNLIVINEYLANNTEDGNLKDQYNANVINCSDEYLTILEIKLAESEGLTIGGKSDNIFNTAYYNIMSGKADAYANMGDYESVLATYVEIEEKLGKENTLSNKVYADHLDYIYSYCVEVNQDPANWKRLCSDELEDLLAIYEEGQEVVDITTNRTWNKRKDTVDKLAKGQYDENNETENASETEGDQASEDSEMGE